ncbi:MAG: hypothetical protein O7G30_17350 [Proteobacteria bacterium]|nr:hypothetical protein [Pseudomonadota bacterium]
MPGSLRRAALFSLLGGAAGLAWLGLRLRPQRGSAPPVEEGRHRVRVLETRRIVPGPGLPPELALGAANNNLDAVRHSDGFVYLAFRTAPHHFAGPHTAICIVRSRDEERWTLEARFAIGSDLREPRLLSLGDRLLLYVSRLGRDPLAFEPQGLSLAERQPDGSWSDLSSLGPPGVMGWRVRRLGPGGVPVMLVYAGGESIYDGSRPNLRVEMWRSDDGRHWEPFDPERPVVYEGGGSEADCVLGEDGTLYGVIRNEAGDASGWGALVCRAPAGDLANWTCRPDPRKYDSPFAFWHDGEAYFVARRNLNGCGGGAYDLGRGPGWLLRTVWNQVNYSLSPKRTALWRYVQDEDRLAFVCDLPSRGDCCFPAVLEGEREDERIVYDYSCDLDGPDLPWLRGQRARTHIYRHRLRFEPAG